MSCKASFFNQRISATFFRKKLSWDSQLKNRLFSIYLCLLRRDTIMRPTKMNGLFDNTFGYCLQALVFLWEIPAVTWLFSSLGWQASSWFHPECILVTGSGTCGSWINIYKKIFCKKKNCFFQKIIWIDCKFLSVTILNIHDKLQMWDNSAALFTFVCVVLRLGGRRGVSCD